MLLVKLILRHYLDFLKQRTPILISAALFLFISLAFIAYSFTRPTVYQSHFLISVNSGSPVTKSQLSNYFLSREFRRLVDLKSSVVHISNGQTVGLFINSLSLKENKRIYRQVSSLLQSGATSFQRIRAKYYLSAVTSIFNSTKTADSLEINSPISQNSHATADLIPLVTRSMLKIKIRITNSILSQLSHERGRSIASTDISKIKHEVESYRTQLDAVNNGNLQNFEYGPVDMQIAQNILRRFLANQALFFKTELSFAGDDIKLRGAFPPARVGFSILEFLALALVITSTLLLATGLFKVLQETDYDSKKILAQGYRFDCYTEKDCNSLIKKEIITFVKNKPNCGQTAVVTTMGFDSISSHFTEELTSHLAAQDAKVLIIDLHNNSSEIVNRLPNNITCGISDYLYGNARLEECIYSSRFKNVFVLPLGFQSKIAIDIVDHIEFRRLLSERHGFDFIFFYGTFDDVKAISKVSYYANALYFFADSKQLRPETSNRLLRLFAVYNGTRKYLIQFNEVARSHTADVA